MQKLEYIKYRENSLIDFLIKYWDRIKKGRFEKEGNPNLYMDDFLKNPELFYLDSIALHNPWIDFEHYDYFDKNSLVYFVECNHNIDVKTRLLFLLKRKGYISEKDITIDDILTNYIFFDLLSWHDLSVELDISYIEKYPNLPWSYPDISYNKSLTLNYYLKNKDYLTLPIVIMNSKDVIKILDYHNKDNQLKYIGRLSSSNPYIDIDTVLKYEGWNWYELSKNSGIKIEDIIATIDTLPWDSEGLSKHPNINLDFIKKYPNIKYNWQSLSKNIQMDINELQDNLNLPWDWDFLSQNCNIPLKDIMTKIGYPWNFYYLSINHFLYNDFSYEYNIRKDISKKRHSIKPILNHIYYCDLTSIILLYTDYK